MTGKNKTKTRQSSWNKQEMPSQFDGSWTTLPHCSALMLRLLQIIVNGEEYHTFEHRVPVSRVRALNIKGDVDIRSIIILAVRLLSNYKIFHNGPWFGFTVLCRHFRVERNNSQTMRCATLSISTYFNKYYNHRNALFSDAFQNKCCSFFSGSFRTTIQALICQWVNCRIQLQQWI